MTESDDATKTAALRKYMTALEELLTAIGVDPDGGPTIEANVFEGQATVNELYWCDGSDEIATWPVVDEPTTEP